MLAVGLHPLTSQLSLASVEPVPSSYLTSLIVFPSSLSWSQPVRSVQSPELDHSLHNEMFHALVYFLDEKLLYMSSWSDIKSLTRLSSQGPVERS